jgi:transcriptional regulator with XRE-family HTH domain
MQMYREIGPRMLRYNNNKKLREVSAGTVLSISHLSDIERGKCMPTVKTLLKICNYFGAPMSCMFWEKPDKRKPNE